MTKELHIAAQYLSAAAISFLKKEEDDSHTNLIWDPATSSLLGHDLRGDELRMALNFKDLSIEFRRKGMVLAKLPLSQTRHFENVKWLAEVFRDFLFEDSYEFNLPYELPYEDFNMDYTFPYRNEHELKKQADLRNKAHTVLTELTVNHNEPSEVRTWPHHFDTAALLWISEMDSIGLGLAIPDCMSKEHYFYVSGWRGHGMMETSNFNRLKQGLWLKNSWKGAVLKARRRSLDEIRSFFENALMAYDQYAEKVA